MAKVEGGWGENFRGKLDGLSFYKMRGVDKTIIRKSGGHTSERLKNDPNLEQFRMAGVEFGGRALASRYLMNALKYHKPLADHNIAGPLNALMKSVQDLESVNEWGKRAILLSDHPHFLKGFSLNRKHPFDSVIRYPIGCVLDRSAMAATIYVPELIPGINFVPPVNHPYYSLRVTLGVVPDVIYHVDSYVALHPDYPEHCIAKIDTKWFSLMGGSPALEIVIKNNFVPLDDNCTLVLAVGIRYGVLKDIDKIEQAPYVGSAKVLEVG